MVKKFVFSVTTLREGWSVSTLREGWSVSTLGVDWGGNTHRGVVNKYIDNVGGQLVH